MADPVTLFLVASGLGSAAYATYLRYKRMEEAPPPAMFQGPVVSIGSAVEGQMQLVSGQVVWPTSGQPLIAPLSGRPCVYYELTILEREPGDGDDNDYGGWATRLFDWAGGDFIIEDGTGRALIHQERPQVYLDIDCVAKPKLFRKLPEGLPAVVEHLHRRGKMLPPLGGHALMVREGVLELRERVFVWGFARWESDPSGGTYRQTARRLLLTPSGNGQMAITDIVPKLA